MSKLSLKLFTNAMGLAREKSRFTYLNFYGQKVDIPYIVWKIEGTDQNVIIDAGCGAEDYYRVIKGGSAGQFIAGGESFKDVQDVTRFEDGLAAWGLKPEDVDILIITHLHWDHVINAEKCVNARIIVQEAEWEAAINPHPLQKFAYAPRWFYEGLKNVEFVKGDVDFLPGVRLILTPGHTPGGQTVAIETEKGWYAISGYCAINDNFYPPAELQKAIGYPIIPAAVHTDSVEAYNSSFRLLKEFGDKILPSHEQALINVTQVP